MLESLEERRLLSSTVADAGFESPHVGTGSSAYAYGPTGTAWTFSGAAGVAGNDSAFTSSNPAAPEGTQVGFLQGTGSDTQTLALPAGGYVVSFNAAQRGNNHQDFQVLVGGTVVGTFTPPGNGFAPYVSAGFTLASAGAPALVFRGLDTAGGDNTAFIDNVDIAAPIATNLAATPSDSAVSLAWQGISGATAYVVQRAPGSDPTNFASVDTVEAVSAPSQSYRYLDTNVGLRLNASTAYVYRIVTAFPGAGSNPSATASATTLAAAGSPLFSGPAAIPQGMPYTLNLSAAGVGAVDHWSINWSDGAAASPDIETFTGNPASVTHTFTNTGSAATPAAITATVTDAAGTHTAAPTQSDLGFGTAGRAITDLGSNGNDELASMLVQPDGKVLVAGTSVQGDWVFALTRYNADGSLDDTFGSGGVAYSHVAGHNWGHYLALQPNGDILLAGVVDSLAGFEFGVTRYLPDGTLDTSFGDGGLASHTFSGAWGDGANAVALQPSGKIVLAGTGTDSSGHQDFALVRFNASGTLDTTFGAGGTVLTDAAGNGSNAITALTVLPNGDLVAAGHSVDFTLARYSADGALVAGFGYGGILRTNTGNFYDQVNSIAYDPSSDTIVAAGQAYDYSRGGTEFVMARYNASSGALVNSFGSAGLVYTEFGVNDRANDVTFDAQGRVLASGFSLQSDGRWDLAVARYAPDGTPDPTFGDAGKLLQDGATFGWNSAPTVAVQSDGGILLAGTVQPLPGHAGSQNFGLSRYWADAPVSSPATGTHGSWKGVYGSQGYVLPSDATSLPSYATFSTDAVTPYVWAASTGDARALQKATGSGRQAATWYSATAFDVNLALSDSQTHHVALYVLDYDTSNARSERIDMIDPATGGVLASQTVSSFSGGKYILFDVTGNVTFRFTNVGPYNAVFSGLFLDPGPAEATSDNAQTVSIAPIPTPTVTGDASVDEASLYFVDLASSANPSADGITSWSIDWGDDATDTLDGNPDFAAHSYASAGTYTISATATNPAGTYSASDKTITVNQVDPAPVITGDSSVDEGSTYTLSLDAGEPGSEGVSRWVITWGDDSAPDVFEGSLTSAVHTYMHAQSGAYTIHAYVQQGDESSTQYTAASQNVTVNRVAPEIYVSTAWSETDLAVLNFNAIEHGDEQIESYTINWDDGSAPEVVTGSGEASHAFEPDLKLHSVVVSVTDNHGTTSAEPVPMLGLYRDNFANGDSTHWSASTFDTGHALGALGEFNPGQSVTLTLDDLAPHALLDLSFAYYVHHDPNGAGSTPANDVSALSVNAGGGSLTPSTSTPGGGTYESGAVLNYQVQHTGNSLTITFAAPALSSGDTWSIGDVTVRSLTPVITVTKTQDGSEDGQRPVIFTVHRAADSLDPLDVYYTLGGTATPGVLATDGSGTVAPGDADYTGQVAAAGQSGVYVAHFSTGETSKQVVLTPVAHTASSGVVDVLFQLATPPALAGTPVQYVFPPAIAVAIANIDNGPDVTLEVTKDVKLLEKHSWKVDLPAGKTATKVVFEVKRSLAGGDWQTIQNGDNTSLTYQDMARVQGAWQVRARVTIGGVEEVTKAQTVSVHNVTAAEVLAGDGVKAKMDASWKSTKDYAKSGDADDGNNTHKVREEAFFISLDTATGKYVFGDLKMGGAVQLDGTLATQNKAETQVGEPPKDDPEKPKFTDAPKYVEALFHTHTSMQWVQPNNRPNGKSFSRDLGPSARDKAYVEKFGVYGFVYDYKKTNAVRELPRVPNDPRPAPTIPVVVAGADTEADGSIYTFGDE